MTRKVSLLFLSLALLLSACAAPEVQATPTAIPPMWTSLPTDTPTLPPTNTPPPSLTPTLTPTFSGPANTRTPAPAARCPKPSNRPYTITLSEKHREDYETQIQNYMNTHGSAVGLEAALNRIITDPSQSLRVQITSQDVTDDQTPETIIELFYPSSYTWETPGTLFVFTCQAGKYQSILYWGFGYHEALFAITDMNGDRVPEIVSTERFPPVESDPRGFLIREWNGTDFTDLTTPGYVSSPVISGGDGVITDTDKNGTLELIISGDYGTPHYGPGRSLHQLWAWDGKAFTLYSAYVDPPVWRYEAVYEGDAASKARYYAIARDSYQRAIFDDSLLAWSKDQDPLNPQPGLGDPDERARLSAYARYRLLLLDVAQSNLDDAQMTYETLQSQFPPGTAGHEYTGWASFFWQAYTSNYNLEDACNKVMEESNFPYPRDIIEPLATQANRDLAYYDSYDVCPFHTIAIS